MFKNKKVLVNLSVATLLSVGAVTVSQTNTTPTVVEASVSQKKLTHNAYVYKSTGKRYGKKVLKKGKTVKVYGAKTIKGKKYYRIGKNQYVKVSNFKVRKMANVVANNSVKGQYHLTHNAYVYNSKGQRVNSEGTLKKNHIFNVVGTKNINGQSYLALGNDRFVKTSNAESVVQNNTNTNVSVPNNSNSANTNTNAGTNVTVPNGTNKENQSKPTTPSGNTNTNDNKENTKPSKNADYIKFSESEVNQIQSYLWQRINEYRQSKGYPAYKTNAELTNFVNRSLEEGTPEYKTVGYGNGTIQNTDTLGQFLPKLKALGMDSARSMTDLDAFGYGSAKQFFLNLKEKDPKKVADEIFNAYTKEDDSMNLRTLQGYKDKYAYAGLKVKYNGEGTYSQRGLILNFTVVGSYAPEWVSAWEKD